MSSVTIRGGMLANAADVFTADISVVNERIAAVATPGTLPAAERTLDATGCYVTPAGVDVHTHLQHRGAAELQTADDFYTGTVAAAAGGTTTIVDFAPAHGDASLVQAVEARLEAARDRCVIDYSFHAAITTSGLKHGVADMDAVARAGVTTFKVYMAYPGQMMSDDSTLLEVMSIAARLGCLVIVHAENGHIVSHRTRLLVEVGATEEHMHLHAHPEIAEVEAVHRVIQLAALAGGDLYVLHISSGLAADELARAKARGCRVWGETCPQYLFAAYEDYEGLGYEAAKYICSPPIRERANQAALWNALSSGAISTFATDHAPYTVHGDDGAPGQKARGRGNFPDIPNGVPGIEDRLKLLLEFGVGAERISLPRFVDLVASQPAKLMSIYPQKGSLAVGADADIVVWDPDAPHVIRASEQHMNVDYNLYEGLSISWKPRFVLSRGEVIVENGAVRAEPGRGRFLKRGPFRGQPVSAA